MTPESFGATLKKERERRSLELGAIARATRIPVRQLELVEAGALDELPAVVFVRGFVKSYARALGIDAEGLLAALDRDVAAREAARQAPAPPEPTGERALPLHPPRRVQVALFVLLIVLLVVAARWLAP